MYEELIKRLRSESALPYGAIKDMHEAADAIEKLQEDSVPIDDMEMILSEVAKPRWISVTQRLPESGWYLVRCNEVHKHIHRIAYYYNTTWYENSNNIAEFVTHWISLPEAPKEEHTDV